MEQLQLASRAGSQVFFVNTLRAFGQILSREPEAKWIKCGRSPPSPQQRMMTAVPKRSNSLVQTLKGMVNVFPKNRLPKFAFNDDLEREVMEGVLR